MTLYSDSEQTGWIFLYESGTNFYELQHSQGVIVLKDSDEKRMGFGGRIMSGHLDGSWGIQLN